MIFLAGVVICGDLAARSLARDLAAGPLEKQRMKGILPTRPRFDRSGLHVVHEGRVSIV
jgi:hypothetical protein